MDSPSSLDSGWGPQDNFVQAVRMSSLCKQSGQSDTLNRYTKRDITEQLMCSATRVYICTLVGLW